MQVSITTAEFAEPDLSRPSSGEISTFDSRPTPKPLSLRWNVSWSALGNVAYAATQWGILVLLAKLGTHEMLGQYALGLAVAGPVFMLANLQLRVVQATDSHGEYKFGDHLALRLVTSTVAFAAVAIFALLGGFRAGTAAVIVGVGGLKTLESVSEIIHGLLQRHERMDRIALMQMIKGCLSLVAMGIGLATTSNVAVGVAAMVLIWALSQAVFEWPCAFWVLGRRQLVDLMPRWNLSTMRQLAWRALPLGFVMMLSSLFVNIPRYMIERSFGEATLGIYSAIAYLIVAGGTINNALGQAASPRLARIYAQGDRHAFFQLLAKLMGAGLLVGGGGILASLVAGPELLALVYGTGYADYSDLLIWIMIASAVANLAAPLGYAMTAAGYYRVQIPLMLIVTLATTLSSSLLVPDHSLLGGAWALLLAYSVLFLGALGVLFYDLMSRQEVQR